MVKHQERVKGTASIWAGWPAHFSDHALHPITRASPLFLNLISNYFSGWDTLLCVSGGLSATNWSQTTSPMVFSGSTCPIWLLGSCGHTGLRQTYSCHATAFRTSPTLSTGIKKWQSSPVAGRNCAAWQSVLVATLGCISFSCLRTVCSYVSKSVT